MRVSSVRQGKVGRVLQVRTQTLASRDADGRVLERRKRTVLVACPAVRLVGLWLEEAGFYIGDTLTVHVADGQITIRKEVSPDAVGVCAVASGQVDGQEAGVGRLSLVEGCGQAARDGV